MGARPLLRVIEDAVGEMTVNRGAAWMMAITLGLAGGCSRPPRDRAGGSTAGAPADAANPVVEFIEDDYPRALTLARTLQRPLFVDAWAPWCHTCLSMRSFVFNDPVLAQVASRFVWLAVDTEKERNAAFVAKFPMEAWPTLFVVEAANETPVLKWPGSATATELVMLLDAALGSAAGAAEATAAWLRGNRAAAGDQLDQAIAEYRKALVAMAPRDVQRGRVAEAMIGLLSRQKQHSDCLNLALAEVPQLPPGTSRATLALTGLECGMSLSRDDPGREGLPALVSQMARMAEDPSEPILADDRSALFEGIVDFGNESGDAGAARDEARRWSTFLDGEAARAPNAAARASFDSNRLLAYIALGETERTLPVLEQSERDFPDDYNPPARIAKANLELKRYDAALAAVTRALRKVYGPRTLRILWLEVDILEAMGKKNEARDALDRALDLGKRQSLSGGYARLLDQMTKRRARM